MEGKILDFATIKEAKEKLFKNGARGLEQCFLCKTIEKKEDMLHRHNSSMCRKCFFEMIMAKFFVIHKERYGN